MTLYSDRLARGQRQYGDQFDPSELAANNDLRIAYNDDKRVLIDYYGERVTGTVSSTTGYRPSYLLVRRSSDHGSSYVLSDQTPILAVQHVRGGPYLDKYGNVVKVNL